MSRLTLALLSPEALLVKVSTYPLTRTPPFKYGAAVDSLRGRMETGAATVGACVALLERGG